MSEKTMKRKRRELQREDLVEGRGMKSMRREESRLPTSEGFPLSDALINIDEAEVLEEPNVQFSRLLLNPSLDRTDTLPSDRHSPENAGHDHILSSSPPPAATFASVGTVSDDQDERQLLEFFGVSDDGDGWEGPGGDEDAELMQSAERMEESGELGGNEDEEGENAFLEGMGGSKGTRDINGLIKLVSQGILSTRLTVEENDALQDMPGFDFQEDTFLSEYRLRQGLANEGDIPVTKVDCCENGCVAFTGPLQLDDACYKCSKPRWRDTDGPNKVPRQSFLYISPISRLVSLHRDVQIAPRLRYPVVPNRDSAKTEDVWDGTHIANLRNQNVTWAGQEIRPPRRYFDPPTDIALGLATDGIPLFNRSPVDCWPLLLINYSLPPHMRNRREHQLCCGLIPGKKEKRRGPAIPGGVIDIDSFLRPLIDDLRKLACEGVYCLGWSDSMSRLQSFRLRAHLVLVIGDMPAISKVMHFKGLNSKVPCRCCTLAATYCQKNRHYYVLSAVEPGDNEMPSYLQLPLRDEVETKLTASWLRAMPACSARDEVENETGINDEALLSIVGSLSFPWSFPIDIMHALYENIMKGFLKVWKEPDSKSKQKELAGEPFIIPKAKWEEMAREIAASNKTVPNTMASRIHDPDTRGFWTAESYSYFLMFLGPIVLKDRLADEYYTHFLRLPNIVRQITAIELDLDSLDPLEHEIAGWVSDFERLYYQYRDENMPFCTAPIHSLLHIVENIRRTGPPCHNWCFSMERFGGAIKRQVTNRVKPIVALTNRVLKDELILQVISRLSIADQRRVLTWKAGRKGLKPFLDEDSPSKLYDRTKTCRPPSISVMNAVWAFLDAREYVPDRIHRERATAVLLAEVREVVFEEYTAWRSSREDAEQVYMTPQKFRLESTDASWVVYDQAYDKNQRYMGRVADFRRIEDTQHGQLLHIYRFQWRGESLTIAVVRPWVVRPWLPLRAAEFLNPPMQLVSAEHRLQAMDIKALRNVVGRVPTVGRQGHVIFDTSGRSLIPEMTE